jgi:hypothetical protein
MTRAASGLMGFSGSDEDLDTLLSSFATASFGEGQDDLLAAIDTTTHSFGIRPADSDGHRRDAGMLIKKMYAWRGYPATPGLSRRPDQMTLVASDYRTGTPIGTLTIGLDGAMGLMADQMYRTEADALRQAGARLCEMTRFAIERSVNSKRLLGALFHVSFIFAYHIHRRSDLLIEVTPQHGRFYRHLLGFEQFGREVLNPRVNTRGVLLRLPLHYAAENIRRFGGSGDGSSEKSLYPYAFSSAEEAGVIARLKRIDAGIESDVAARTDAPA